MVRERLKTWYESLISLKGEPRAIAFGLAIGVFIGATPTIPFHTVLIILLCFLLKKNMTAAYLGSWVISNPLTIPFLYFFQYRLGGCLLGNSYTVFPAPDYSLGSIIQHGGYLVIPLLAGGIIMAPFFAIPAYFISHKLILAIRNNCHDRSEENP
ncbi:MAG TPA: DUF2062 domain-containing protein [Syntrophales bacterium]|nr:DUF2062 domain-containing protein [Syntrophales bacterium]